MIEVTNENPWVVCPEVDGCYKASSCLHATKHQWRSGADSPCTPIDRESFCPACRIPIESETGDIAMEDIQSIGLGAMKVIKADLAKKGIEITPEQEDLIYVPMCAVLEKIAGYPDYRHHN